MGLYDLSSDMLAFYDKYVKLNAESEKRLVEVRDLNLKRITNGLSDLDKPDFKAWRNQGGYAMKTVIDDPAGESDHDIDVAVIFDKDDLPSGALSSRQRVRDALCKRGTNFLLEPEARTNAVTVWYADGYHLDFAVYRRSTNDYGVTTYEHASTEWVARDPSEVTIWFNGAVDEKSPKADLWGNKPVVRTKQLRRLVRLIKWFARSRPSWNLPGGMIVSTLVVECYQANRDRDDVALYNTLVAIRNRLQLGCAVYHPKGDGRELTGKSEYLTQVTLLKEKLEAHIPRLDVLLAADCTREKARHAWDWIFNHSFWADKEVLEEARMAKADTSIAGYFIHMDCDLTKGERGRIISQYRGQPIPKKMGLRFYVTSTNVARPYTLRFEATNQGDEARMAQCLGWSADTTDQTPEWWTGSAYKGTHRMTCTVIKDGIPVASTSMIVKIVGGMFRGQR